MAATSPTMVTNVPALAACAPSGATQVITGTLLPRMALVISSVLVSSPPGVSITRSTAAAPSSRAMARPSWM